MSDNESMPWGKPAKPSYRCPFCGVKTTITPIKWTMTDWIGQCDNNECGKIFYAKVRVIAERVAPQEVEQHFEIVETYPKYVPARHVSIPENVWSDYLEGCESFDVKAFKASVVMCRRMLQNVCQHRNAKNKDDEGHWITLRNQLKEAFPKKEYPRIHSFAEKVKYFGDYGAHPQDDNIDDVSEEVSKKILDFSYTILEIVYISPWELENLDT